MMMLPRSPRRVTVSQISCERGREGGGKGEEALEKEREGRRRREERTVLTMPAAPGKAKGPTRR